MAQVKNLCNKGIVLEKGEVVRQDDDIYKSVNYYLFGDISENSKNLLHWENDGNTGDSCFRPNKIDLISNDENITASSNLTLSLDYTIEDVASNLSFEFYVYTADTEQLVCSFSPYYSIENFTASVGHHIVSCKLPVDFFNDRRYRIELQAGLFCQRWILEPNVTAPNLYFYVNSKKSFNPFIRASVEACFPAVSWEVEQ